METTPSREELKRRAAHAAVEAVASGMVLGLGTGSTTAYAVERIGELWQEGTLRDIVGIPTSEKTTAIARRFDLPLVGLDTHPRVDLAIDGADEVDPRLDLIKGLGGALLREKAVERVAERFIVIVDDNKWVERLGTRAPLPVEVARDGWQSVLPWLAELACTPRLRGGEGDPFISDNGNVIIDCAFADGIVDAASLAATLDQRDDVLAHGLFLDMASEVIIAGSGGIERKSRAARS